MKIINNGIEQIQLGVVVNLRIEQETEPFNSFDPAVGLTAAEVEGLTENQIVTLAFNRVRWQVIDGFKKAVEGLEEISYQSETEVYEGFEYSEPPQPEPVDPIEPPQPPVDIYEEVESLKILVAELGLMVGGGL